jgi:hypothetical protein
MTMSGGPQAPLVPGFQGAMARRPGAPESPWRDMLPYPRTPSRAYP